MGKNPQIAVNQYIITGLDQGKSLFRDSVLKAILRKNGLWKSDHQEQSIRNSRFFRQNPTEIADVGLVWVLLKRNIVGNFVIDTQTAEVKTIDEALAGGV